MTSHSGFAKPSTIVCFLIFLAGTLAGQEVSNIPGAFTESGFGARPAGMGQAYAALSNDANAFLTNPAGLLTGNRPAFTANYAKLFGLVPSGYFGLMYPVNRKYSLGAGFLFVGDDALMENTLGLAFAFTLPNIGIGAREIYFDQMSFGITVKGRWASFGNNADGGPMQVTGSGQGYAIDLGYVLIVNQNLRLGVTAKDVIDSFRWDSSVRGSYSEDIPATLRFGGAYNLNGLTIAFDLRKNLHSDTANRTYFGAEKRFSDFLVLRAGFSNNLGTTDLNRRWSFGLGVLRNVLDRYTVGINTAYRVGNIENLFRFGMDIAWGTPKVAAPVGRIY